MCSFLPGNFHAGTREHQDRRRHQGTVGIIDAGEGTAGGGAGHGDGPASVLHPHHGGVHDEADDAHHAADAADAVRLAARLPAQESVEHRVEDDAYVGQTGCPGTQGTLVLLVYSNS